MRLPEDQVGPTDINSRRDCPKRFENGMRRWTEGEDPPEAKHPDTMFGSAIHHAIERMESDVLTPAEAAQAAFNEYGEYLDPETMERLEKDLETYQERDPQNVRTVLIEGEIRTPLLRWCHDCKLEVDLGDCPGCGEAPTTIYFRGKIDRLYERVDRPGHFIHIDYKSSKWRKSEKEIHSDTQLWGYNWLLHEEYPEIDRLEQIYDQLSYGAVPTSKSPQQREQIKRWIKRQVIAILKDDDPKPRLNDFCAWCPLMPDCPEPARAGKFAHAKIAALAPRNPDSGKVELDADLFEVYVQQMEEVAPAVKALDEFSTVVRKTLREVDPTMRAFFGYETFTKKKDSLSPLTLAEAHEVLGADFYRLVGLTKSKLESELAKDDPRRQAVLDLMESTDSQPQVRKVKE